MRRNRIIKNRRFQKRHTTKSKHKHKKLKSISLYDRETFLSRFGSKSLGTRKLQFKDSKSEKVIDTILLLEYSKIFPGKSLNLKDEIKCFSRDTLINVISSLSRNHGHWLICEEGVKPFFSCTSLYSIERIRKVMSYISHSIWSPKSFAYACEKTLLEFMKLVFSVASKEEKDIYPDDVVEAKIFDILLAINEQIVTRFEKSKRSPNDFALSMYVNMFAHNDFSNLNGNLALSEQIYYAKSFFNFMESRKEYSIFYERFLSKFEISSWKEYLITLTILSTYAIKKESFIIDIRKDDPLNLLSCTLLNHISIDKNAHIENDFANVDANRDFTVFRSAPLIKISEGKYLIYNKQLIINRLYNSIYFDLLPENGLIYKKKKFPQFYKELFVEKYLFDRAMLGCIDERRTATCYPALKDIVSDNFVDINEEDNQPDFYLRENNDIFIFECKAVKLNGDLKANASEDEIMNELSNKLLLKQWNGRCNIGQQSNSPQPVGVGQLVNHIEKLETYEFKWDHIDPSNLTYYPIIVLENNEIAQSPLNEIINEWYDKSINSKAINKLKCKPLIMMTIKSLFLYDDLFKKNGLKYYFDRFIQCCQQRDKYGKIFMSPFVSFDTWMNDNYDSCKQEYYAEFLKELTMSDKIRRTE